MKPILYQWINILLLFAFLAYVLRKKLGAYFAAEREELQKEIKEANVDFEKIQTEFNEIDRAMKQIDLKISELKNFSLKEIEFETKRIESDTAKVIEKMTADGEARIKNEALRAKKILERDLFDAALVLAKNSLREDFKNQNQDWISQMTQTDTPSGKKNYAS